MKNNDTPEYEIAQEREMICPICGWIGSDKRSLNIQMETTIDGNYCMRCYCLWLSRNVTKMVDLATYQKQNRPTVVKQ